MKNNNGSKWLNEHLRFNKPEDLVKQGHLPTEHGDGT